MGKIKIPEHLKGFIEDTYKDTTFYTEDAEKLFENLFKEYYSPLAIKTTVGFFQDLADDINESIRDYNFCKASTLRNICFSDKKRKDIKTLLILYDHLDKELIKKGKGTAKQWIDTINSGKGGYELIKYPASLQGADIINSEFKSKILAQTIIFSPMEFYTAKKDYDCQWYGVFTEKPWDIPRQGLSEMMANIIMSFEDRVAEKVVAVVCGTAGSGKSTYLRRFAVNLMTEKFTVVWVTNLKTLTPELFKLENDKIREYLLIIENWEEYTKSTCREFLNSFKRIDNCRVVIGDRDTTNKDYLDYFDEKNCLPLSSAENKRILDGIVQIIPQWQQVSLDVMVNVEFYDCPLYLILFVIAKTFEKNNTRSLRNWDGILSQFRSIVRYDLLQLYNIHPGLSQALFFLACLHNEFGSDLLITWQSFLKLAEYYGDGRNRLIRQLINPRQSNPAFQILKSYLILNPLVHPDLIDNYLVYFHHSLLPLEGLCQKVTKEWFYDDDIKLELLEILYKEGEVHSSATLYCLLKKRNIITTSNQDKFGNIQTHLELMFIEMQEEFLKEWYSSTGTLGQSNVAFLNILTFQLFWGLYSTDAYKQILGVLKHKGCVTKLVDLAYREANSDMALIYSRQKRERIGQPFFGGFLDNLE